MCASERMTGMKVNVCAFIWRKNIQWCRSLDRKMKMEGNNPACEKYGLSKESPDGKCTVVKVTLETCDSAPKGADSKKACES